MIDFEDTPPYTWVPKQLNKSWFCPTCGEPFADEMNVKSIFATLACEECNHNEVHKPTNEH